MTLGELIDSDQDWQEVSEKEWEILSRGSKSLDDIRQIEYAKSIKRYEKARDKQIKKK
jgi:hypothetical protein